MNYRAAILVLACAAAYAAPDMTAETKGGGRIDLYRDAWQCVGNARRAEFVPSRGDAVHGCWLAAAGDVRIVFLDGDVVQVPIGVFAPPKTF